jgi:RNA polymerase sigma-70 factor (ECF subfamily)
VTGVEDQHSVTKQDEPRVASMETLFRENYQRLVQSLAFITLDREQAADVVQESFLELCIHWPKVSTYPDPAGWLFRVAVNRAKDQRRSLRRLARLIPFLGSPSAKAAGVDDWQPRRELLAAFKKLPQQQRAAASLYYLADLSISEVASILDISEGTVNSHLNRARAALRTFLEAER